MARTAARKANDSFSVRCRIKSLTKPAVRCAWCAQAWKNGSPSRQVIGLDGSPTAMAAVTEVAGRMWTMGSEVRLIAARDEGKRDYKWSCEFLDAARKILERAELAVTELIEEGDPKQVIVASAEEWGADCIFLGANDAPEAETNHLLANEIFCYRVSKYIGAYLASMNGADAIVFAGGIGENSAYIRRLICERLNWFGVELNESNKENFTGGREGLISAENSRSEVFVIPTNEELLIARDTVR